MIFRVLIFALCAVFVSTARAEAQTVNRDDVIYILPFWPGLDSKTSDQIGDEIDNLRSRLGPEGPYVKLGFTTYVDISMDSWTVNTASPEAIRANLVATIQRIDTLIGKALAHNFPLSLMIQTATRARVDPAQTASQIEDVRNMMWYADNVLASGWWTHTRYARKQQAIQEAYIRELGKVLADRMRRYPDTLVAATGDGEQELATERATHIYSDYSPFAVAEFRDWLRHGGLYATNQPFAGQGYSLGARYSGDTTPNDTNGDGISFNADFGQTFATWGLKHFDWILADAFATADPKAISLAAYNALSTKFPNEIPAGFDPPRVPPATHTTSALDTGDKYWDLWVLFKQTMLHRHNIEFSKWMTTSPDGTGATVPSKRWYSNQIAADYLFGGTPAIPNARWHGAMSSLFTADVSPYGGLGITAFNLDFRTVCEGNGGTIPVGCYVAKTLANAAPVIAARNVRFGLIEWNPGLIPGDTPTLNADVFNEEMALVEQYWPRLIQPFYWGSTTQDNKIEDTLFESSMKAMIARIKDGKPAAPAVISDLADNASISPPLALTGYAVDTGGIPSPDATGPGMNQVTVQFYKQGTTPPGAVAATYGVARSDVASSLGARFANSGFSFTIPKVAAGVYDIVISARSTVGEAATTTKTMTVTVAYTATASPAALQFGGTKANAGGAVSTVTAPQVITPSYGGTEIPAWTATGDQPWMQVVAGPATGQFTVAIINPNNVIGAQTSLSGAVTIVSTNPALSLTVPVTLKVVETGNSPLPFGSFDTPLTSTTPVSGSIQVSGWALDDVGIQSVQIWRDLVPGEPTPVYNDPSHLGHGKIYVANVAFVEGARPDIAAAFPNNPNAHRAGWGYLMLSQGLYNQGNDTFTFYAFAYDLDGRGTSLGSKTIVVSNATAVRPFGNIDQPANGQTLSGQDNPVSHWNFGWALTPPSTPPCTIVNGSVFVSFDSGPLVPVDYGDLRTDIQGAFPTHTNANGAGGAFHIDINTLSNGLHSLGWYVVDDCSRSEGIGSRFVNIVKTSGNAPLETDRTPLTAGRAAATTTAPVQVVRASGNQWVSPDASGSRLVRIGENERVEVVLPDSNGAAYRGYQLVGGQRQALPLGSSLDATGTFYWHPVPAFLGTFDLEFAAGDALTQVRMVVGPSVRMAIDTPQPDATVGGSFAIGGWALDVAGPGSGVDAVDVWAYPVGAADANPIFVGSAAYGGTRPDVSAIYGPAFAPVGYDVTASGLAPGTYDLVVSARSTSTGAFDGAQVVRVTVR